MLNITSLDSRGKSAKGVDVFRYLLKTELRYYRDGGVDKSSSEWLGQGAKDLGLQGSAQVEDMENLGKGFAPDGKTKLCQNAGAAARQTLLFNRDGTPKLDDEGKQRVRVSGGHRIGLDLTFCADQSLSCAYALTLKQGRTDTANDLLAAHSEAVRKTMAHIESNVVETRRGKAGIDVIGCSGIAASAHLHVGSRENEPTIHTHVLLYSVVRGVDGQWGSLSNENLFADQKTLGALYRAELGSQMKQRGYGVERFVERDQQGQETGQTYVRLAGISDELRDRFSTRRKQVVAYAEEHGVSKQTAALRTRKAKEEPDLEEMRKDWDIAIDELANKHPLAVPHDVEQLKGLPHKLVDRNEPERTQQEKDADVVQRLHDHAQSAIFTRSDLIGRIAQDRAGELDLKGVMKEADAFLARNSDTVLRLDAVGLHPADRGTTLARRHREDRFAAKWMVQMEQDIYQRAAARKDDKTVRLDKEQIDTAIQKIEQQDGRTFFAGQKAAIHHVVGETGGVAVVSGHAGAGKTFSTRAMVEAYRSAGREIIGTATAWDAAQKLEAEAGIRSHSVASLLQQLENGKIQLTPKSVVLFDEAGMADSRSLHALQQWTDHAHAKLVVQGDGLQLQPVGAGNPFRIVIRASGEAVLSDIVRQKSAQDLQTARDFYGRDHQLRSRAENRQFGAQLLARLDANGQLETFSDREKAKKRLVADYLASPEPAFEKLIIAGKRADVRALNEEVRARLKEQGKIRGEEITFEPKSRTDAPPTMTVAVGDRVRFTERQKYMGVVNGDVGTVAEVKNGRFVVQLESEVRGKHGKRVVVDPVKYPHLAFAYASTVHKAQGQGKQAVFALADLGMMDRQQMLVSFTRMKKSFRLYGSDAELDPAIAAERMGTDRIKENASDILKKPTPTPKRPEVPSPEPGTKRSASAHLRIIEEARRATERSMERIRKSMEALRGLAKKGPSLGR